MNNTLKDERNPGQCLLRYREQKSLKFKRWLSKDDQRPLWNTWTTNKISLKRQMANQLNNQNKREWNNQQERQWKNTKESATTSGQRNADLNLKETKKTSIAYCKPWNPPTRKTIAIITLQNWHFTTHKTA